MRLITSIYGNGLAEWAVQIFKSAIKKFENLLFSLLWYHVTLQSTTGLTCSELLMGRKLCTIFDLLHPDLSDKVKQKQSKIPHQKVCIFSTGDKIYAKNYSGSPSWMPGTHPLLVIINF